MKILMIGNSFADNTIKYTYEIMESIGVNDFDIWSLFVPGCSIDTHLYNIQNEIPRYSLREYDKINKCWTSTPNHTINELLDIREYDYIFFQQASHDSGIPESYDNLDTLMDEVEKRSKNAVFCWLMTWEYSSYTVHPEYTRYNKDSEHMYKCICKSVLNKIVPNERIDRIIPTGTAIHILYHNGLNVHVEDGFHLNNEIGEYTAGLCLINAFYNIDYKKVFVPNGIGEEEKGSVHKAVKMAYKNTFIQ